MPPPETPFAAPDSPPRPATARPPLDHPDEGFFRAEVARLTAEACRQAAGGDGPALPGSTAYGWAGSACGGPESAPAGGGSVLSMWSVAGSATGRGERCPRCRTVCADDDAHCPACRAPLGGDASELSPAARGRRAARLGLLCLALGAGLGPLIGGSLPLVARPAGGPDVNLILWACLGGGAGAAAGYALGLARRRDAPAVVRVSCPVLRGDVGAAGVSLDDKLRQVERHASKLARRARAVEARTRDAPPE